MDWSIPVSWSVVSTRSEKISTSSTYKYFDFERFVTNRQQSREKVMFSQASVCSQCDRGCVSLVSGPSLILGSMSFLGVGYLGEDCLQARISGARVSWGRESGGRVSGGVYTLHQNGWHFTGRYASYWNVFSYFTQ